MSEIEIDSEQKNPSVLYGKFQKGTERPKTISWLLKLGIVKTEAQANFVILSATILFFIISIFIFKLI